MCTPTLHTTVLYPEEDGSNWAIFTTCFRGVLKAISGEPDATEAVTHAHDDRAEPDLQTGQPGDPNANTPKGVAHAEQDSTQGEETASNAPAHLEGAGPEPSMDEKEDHSLEVEEEGIAGENASVERDIGPRVELQIPGVSPLATHEDIGLLTSPSPSSSPLTPEAASMQCSPVANTGTSATPDNDSAEDAEEAFRAKTSRAEDEEALDWAGLDDQPVKEGEEWNADEEAGAVTTPLVEDAPRIESRPTPHNALHAHTPTSEAASTQRSPAVNSGTPGIPEPEDRGRELGPAAA